MLFDFSDFNTPLQSGICVMKMQFKQVEILAIISSNKGKNDGKSALKILQVEK